MTTLVLFSADRNYQDAIRLLKGLRGELEIQPLTDERCLAIDTLTKALIYLLRQWDQHQQLGCCKGKGRI